jgi:hypothetical protein
MLSPSGLKVYGYKAPTDSFTKTVIQIRGWRWERNNRETELVQENGPEDGD